jgi:transcriptional regulator with XRE-family HTH domain
MPSLIPDLMRRRKAELDLTWPQVAAACHVHEQAVLSWSRGDYAPSPNKYADLAGVLGVPVREVVLAAGGLGPDPVVESP